MFPSLVPVAQYFLRSSLSVWVIIKQHVPTVWRASEAVLELRHTEAPLLWEAGVHPAHAAVQASDVTSLPGFEAQVRTLQQTHKLMSRLWLLDSWDMVWRAADERPLPGRPKATGSLVAQHTVHEVVLDVLPCFSWCSTTARFVRMVSGDLVGMPAQRAAQLPVPLDRISWVCTHVHAMGRRQVLCSSQVAC